jgi:hypothetical protein
MGPIAGGSLAAAKAKFGGERGRSYLRVTFVDRWRVENPAWQLTSGRATPEWERRREFPPTRRRSFPERLPRGTGRLKRGAAWAIVSVYCAAVGG